MMSNSICLITPPSIFLLDERVFMNLGILRVAAILEQSGYHVDMLDLSGIENYEEALESYLTNSAITTYGITATTPQIPSVMKIVDTIRRHHKDYRIILGGPHVSLVHTAYKGELAKGLEGRATKAIEDLRAKFDILIIGDGEEAIFRALETDSPKEIDANDRNSPLFLTNKRLDELPFPARHLIDVGSYHYSIEGKPALSLIAQLGCPFECGFCGGRQSAYLRLIRTRSTENIIREMREMYLNYGNTGFMFYDDELNVNRGMVGLMRAINSLQKELGVEFRLRGFVKSELFNEEQAEAMYMAGFRWILTGFESGSPKILSNINKKATRDDNTRCVHIARKHGMKVKALMSIGHPGESEETAMETHSWLLENRPDDFDITIITTYPGTPYYDYAVRREDIWVYTYEKTGDKLYSYEVDYNTTSDYYKGDPNGGYKSYVYTDYLTAGQLVGARDFIERDVRSKLGIHFNPSAPSIRFEHSMGQFGTRLPSNILRTSKKVFDNFST